MLDVWLKLGQFITQQFGLPGWIAVAVSCYALWLLNGERQAHAVTRDKIDLINEKRIEFTAQTILTVKNLETTLQAITAILGKQGKPS